QGLGEQSRAGRKHRTISRSPPNFVRPTPRFHRKTARQSFRRIAELTNRQPTFSHEKNNRLPNNIPTSWCLSLAFCSRDLVLLDSDEQKFRHTPTFTTNNACARRINDFPIPAAN